MVSSCVLDVHVTSSGIEADLENVYSSEFRMSDSRLLAKRSAETCE